MSNNTFGRLFRVTTWGESHGPALGAIVDGCPAGLRLDEGMIQPWLDKRRPGSSRHVSPRQEADQVQILSGTFSDDRTNGPVTTGAPISLMIENTDARSKDYSDIRDKWRPGHADYTYDAKYGVRDYRGGGRSSARETAARVAAGAIARQILGPEILIRGALIQLGDKTIDRSSWDWDETGRNPFFSPDAGIVEMWEADLDQLRRDGSSTGAIVELHVTGLPAGWGEPVYGKLDAELAGAMMSIPAAKGVEIGAGFAAAAMRGEEAADEMRAGEDGPEFLSNHNGGVLGGISTGQDLVLRIAIKPTSSIRTERKTLDRDFNETTISTKGRHDPCVGIRAVPVAEAMAAIVLADQMLRHRGQMG
ncbi:chorismate synthase [Hyphobacterium sp. CCMP332]|uniref:chorismate synthase n=1 Tax=Hyphobacterium sp. CCMP332 TaxID=2749086 RepID=UPI00164F69F9|nr:chorismate synthase [Hyphobacterium sp. CCMP332]QNL19188.1 chorismate synthase [Hyphobacterium sp. CCMP332]